MPLTRDPKFKNADEEEIEEKVQVYLNKSSNNKIPIYVPKENKVRTFSLGVISNNCCKQTFSAINPHY